MLLGAFAISMVLPKGATVNIFQFPQIPFSSIFINILEFQLKLVVEFLQGPDTTSCIYT